MPNSYDPHDNDQRYEWNNQKFQNSEQVAPPNKELIQQFCDKCFAEGLSKARVKKYITNWHTIFKMINWEFRSFKKQVVQEEVENGDKQFGMNLKSKTVQDLQDQQQVNAMKGQYSGKDSVLEELHRKANSVFLPPEEASNREIAHALSEWMVDHADYRAFLSVEVEIMKYDPETGTWNENAEVEAKQDIREAVGNLYSQHLKRETLDQVEAIDPVPRDRIGPSQNQVPVKDGILHL